ncbi:MAG TPA: DUF885 domain-containing protein [Candidatus Limnocylindrales bacterium]|nr:DUF885 domain-containing protein [Candidatus Limnocylindrales bacterium]HSG87483.1 DUF885 domain-containing protein [Candidatus Limnocylindrales bacterium]
MAHPATVPLPRPEAPEGAGPLDDRFYGLVEDRFRRLLQDEPVYATMVGLHDLDDRWGDGTRDALLGRIEADRRHLAEVEAIDAAGLSSSARFERDLEIHNLRRELFDAEEVRLWERRSTALDLVGDALFLGFARDFAPLPERLERLGDRMTGIPAFLEQHRTRAVVPQVRVWQRIEIEAAEDLPSFLDEIVAAGRDVLDEPGQRRLEGAADTARGAIARYADELRATLAEGVDDWALGRERYDELVRRRAFDGLDADDILEIGHRQLAEQKAARVAVAREIDPTVDEPTVVDRIKRDQPASFEEALDAYRDAMRRARSHLVVRDLVTVPDDERIEVVETPAYLRNVIPFAAYFDPPRFDEQPTGIYIVTRSVGDDPGAMREHNLSSISNTSIHEAYPGHHLQLTVAVRHPSLTRFMTDAPEFVEGWGMYSEQMMREEGFDDSAPFRLTMHTDAIWRACRIILDIGMHRGEFTIDEATAFLVEHTSFQESNARAEVLRYTYTPTYNFSYLLGKVLILQLREDERRRLGPDFTMRGFHDALLRAGSLPISFHRRLLADATAPGSEGRA